MKKFVSLLLVMCLIIGFAPTALATSINDSTMFFKQSTSTTCTLASSAMMLRRRAFIDGLSDWSSITEANLRGTAWISGSGLRNSFTYKGMSVKNQGLISAGYNTVDKKKSYFISLLSQHPEGIVAYNINNGGQYHAVLMTDYDSSSGTFYCADPSSKAGAGRIAFGNSSIYGSGQDGKFGSINSIWYITNKSGGGTSTPPHTTHTKGAFQFYEAAHPHYNYWSCSVCGKEFTDGSSTKISGCSICYPPLTVVSTTEGTWAIIVPRDKEVPMYLYQNTKNAANKLTTTTKPKRVAATRKVYLSDGTIRYGCYNILGDYEYYYFTSTDDMIIEEGGKLGGHNHVKGRFLYSESSHPHYNFFECSVCEEEYTDESTTKNYSCNKCHPEHTWDAGVITKNPTSTSTGTKRVTCTLCGMTKTEIIPATTPAFDDVKSDAYYAKAVEWAVDRKITSGIGNKKFGPDDPCTRGQIVTFLWRAAGSPEPKTTSCRFVDIKPKDYFYKAVLWAVENEITSGTSAAHFSPNAKCTRAQAITFIWRAKGGPDAKRVASFSDVSSNSYYARAVNWGAEYGVTSGIGNSRFGSDNTCTRGQIVTFIYRGMTR